MANTTDADGDIQFHESKCKKPKFTVADMIRVCEKQGFAVKGCGNGQVRLIPQEELVLSQKLGIRYL